MADVMDQRGDDGGLVGARLGGEMRCLQHMFRNGHRLAKILLVTLVGENIDDGGDHLFGNAVHDCALCSLIMDVSLDFMPSLSG